MAPRPALWTAACALVLGTACYAGVETGPPVVQGYATYYADSVPPDIYAHPYVYYDGRPAYWAYGHWYYETPRGWVNFQRPPPALDRQRPYVQQAPPAARGPYAYPPPAIRVR